MKTTFEQMNAARAEHRQWKQKLDFYKNEIDFLKEKLSLIPLAGASKEVKWLVSHFENQFVINKNIIENLLHTIELNDGLIASEMKEKVVAFEYRAITQTNDVKEQIEIFLRLYTTMKSEFERFVMKVL
jgi:predicted rRNA methylase YqxC with S4 and FtsJ domains